MSKIRLSRVSSNGTSLYGSLRKHHSYVTISIETGNHGDHLRVGREDDETGDDTGFKSAHDSRIMRKEPQYHPTRPSISRNTGKEFLGYKNVEAEELTEIDRNERIVEVTMSHEQFAEMLTSTGHSVDCTLDFIRGFGKKGAIYSEEVTEPASTRSRMIRRLNKAQEKALTEIAKQREAIEELKISEKAKETMRNALRMVEMHLVENAAFTVTQAVEEMSIHAEAATTIIGEKIVSLEKAGRLPAGSSDRFLRGESVLGLPETAEE